MITALVPELEAAEVSRVANTLRGMIKKAVGIDAIITARTFTVVCQTIAGNEALALATAVEDDLHNANRNQTAALGPGAAHLFARVKPGSLHGLMEQLRSQLLTVSRDTDADSQLPLRWPVLGREGLFAADADGGVVRLAAPTGAESQGPGQFGEAVIGAAPQLEVSQARVIFNELIKRFSGDSFQEKPFIRAISALAEKVPEADVTAAFETELKEMLAARGPALLDFSQVLKALAARIPEHKLRSASVDLVNTMTSTNDSSRLVAQSQELAVLVRPGDEQRVIDLLKMPTAVGQVRSRIITALETLAGGQHFEGSQWKVATWASAKHLDVTSPAPGLQPHR